jgi:hypothetical protein
MRPEEQGRFCLPIARATISKSKQAKHSIQFAIVSLLLPKKTSHAKSWIRQVRKIAYKCRKTGRPAFARLGGIAYFLGDRFFCGCDLTLVSALGVL